jgi:oxygen-independent coproporphyrinogen-3 oxidase
VTRPPYGLYLHIPFCAVRCPYCDFNTYAGLEALFESYTAALCEEIRRSGEARGRPSVRTIFIGGGTPTVLEPGQLARVLDACRAAFDVQPDAEITSEANPGTTDGARFAALRDIGVTRLSMGVQSFDDAELRWLGRIHSAAEAEAAFAAAREAGFANINLDFMFGLPGQQLETWSATLRRALALAPEHLSLYSLTVEDGTPLADRVRRGLDAEPDDDLAADLYQHAAEALAAGGYGQYEISNYAKPGHACRHNLVYWRNEPYLGFGAGAHSFDFDPANGPGAGRRWWNVRPVPAYVARINSGRAALADEEAISPRLAMGETMMVGLRLVEEGVADARFGARFGVGLEDAFGAVIARLAGDGLLVRQADGVRLSERGRLLGNQVFAAFLL